MRAVASAPPHCARVPGLTVSGVSMPISRTVVAWPVVSRTFSVSPSMTRTTRALAVGAVAAAGAGATAGGGGAAAVAPAQGHGSDWQARPSLSPSRPSGSPGWAFRWACAAA